jgi:hypothetical protein
MHYESWCSLSDEELAQRDIADVLVQREMETSIRGLGSLGCESCLVVLGFFALVL